jgi:ABC-type nitrate/sulfonate/bicarbonate transport system substrate-binding protein
MEKIRTHLSRGVRCAALAVALAAANVLPPSPAAADTTLIVGKAAPDAEAIIAVDVGDQLGIFKKHGLDLKIVNFDGGSKMIQGMTAGSIDIGDGAGTQMAFVAKGVPMMAVCENTSTLPYQSIGVPYDSPIKTKEELKGKTIGVSASGSLTDWLAQELDRAEGWGPDGVKRVAIGTGAAPTAAFREHLIDAYIGGTTTFLTMEEKQVGRVLTPVSTYIGNIASGTLFASNDLIKKNPDGLRAFLAAWLDTTTYMRTHKDDTVKIESKVTNHDEAVMAKEYDITISMFTPDCRFDKESLVNLSRSFVDLQLLDAAPDMSKLYTEAYLPPAH